MRQREKPCVFPPWVTSRVTPAWERKGIHWLCLIMNSNDPKKMQKYAVGLNVYFILIFTLPFHNVFSWATTNPYICKHTLSGHRKQTCLTGLCFLWVSSAYHRVVSSGPVCLSYLHLLELSDFSVYRALVRAQEEKKQGKIHHLIAIKCIHKYLLMTCYAKYYHVDNLLGSMLCPP